MSIILCHNSQSNEYRSPGGAVLSGTQVRLALTASGADQKAHCRLNLWTRELGAREFPMEKQVLEDGSLLFSISLPVSDTPCLCWYYFVLQGAEGGSSAAAGSGGEDLLYYGNNPEQLGGQGQMYRDIPPAFQITVYETEAVPEWYRNSVVYQIFPDRFSRSSDWTERQQAADPGSDWKGPCRVIQQNWNDTPYYTRNSKGEVTRWPFFGGTLQGIRSRLLYLKSMGAGAIYLNPIFTASSNHKYDTANYLEIDPGFGTLEDFQELAKDARRLGIRLILDGVFNHTGADSIYFNQFGNYQTKGACQGSDSPYYDWYRFTRFPDEYDCWWGVGALPNVEESCPSYQDFIYKDKDSVIRYWLRQGACGWRLDVADELPDSFIAGIRQAVKETCPDGLLLGEVWEDASNKVSYGVQREYLLGRELDSVMNYPFRDLITEFMVGKRPACDVVTGLCSLAENYPPQSFYGALNLVGSHDRVRILTLLGDGPEGLSDGEKETYRLPTDKLGLAKRRLRLLSLFQYMMPGVPCLYYGDEAGAEGYEDPYNRGTYPWGREDQDLLAHYRMLALLRKQYSFLWNGDFDLSCQGEHTLILTRTNREKTGESAAEQASDTDCSETLIAVINRHLFGGAEVELKLPGDTEYVLELLTSEIQEPEGGSLQLHMDPLSCRLFYCTSEKPQGPQLSRSAGVLCHVSSLPSGRMDSDAETFLDYLAACGQRLWQILPLNPVEDATLSPYSSPAVFAGNPRLLDNSSVCSASFDEPAYRAFCRKEAFWLEDYALYCILKQEFSGAPWQQWPEPERDRKNLDYWKKKRAAEIEQIQKEQFAFWSRWQQIKDYANSIGISVIGDLPIYAAVDSADTWANRRAFLLDETGCPIAGAGVPPDYFSEEGQNWGNPLYDWDWMRQDGYTWWLERISHAIERFDYVRLDHFRSFSAFYAIPAGEKARNGWWLPGPGKEFFDFLTKQLGSLPLIAEDLGFLDAQVHNLLKQTGYPGMLVYQLSADEMEHLPEAEAAKRIFYSGTHDNQTLAGWCRDAFAGSSAWQQGGVSAPAGSGNVSDHTPDAGQPEQEAEPKKNSKPDEIIRFLYQSPCPWAIVPLQDLLGLGDESRMNVPGQAEGNWTWKTEAHQLTPRLAAEMKNLTAKSGR